MFILSKVLTVGFHSARNEVSGEIFYFNGVAVDREPLHTCSHQSQLCNGMLGKAVKVRHCPATVSAYRRWTARSVAEKSSRRTTEAFALGRWPGKVPAREARKSGDRSLCDLRRVPRGNGGPMREFKWLPSRRLFFSFTHSAFRIDPELVALRNCARHCYRSTGRTGFRRTSRAVDQRDSSQQRHHRPGWKLPDHHS